ncbi:MAG: putative DNA binding domain-containing protein [Acidobacteria bacterium]|nr:putative DNA binding domain-containing protein [Acidobacteriota bacterium]
MRPLGDPELLVMLRGMESDRVERKESFQGSAPKGVREAVCPFANDVAGHQAPGVVLVGVRDDGTAARNFIVTDELLRALADIKTDGQITPPPSLMVEKRNVEGLELAVVTVWPCDTPPVRYQGRVFIRWGPRRGIATSQDERVLNERRRFGDRPFDVRAVAGATVAEIDLLRFEQEYLPALVARDVLEANERTMAQKLAATKLALGETDSTPTVLGLLVAGRVPADWIPGAYTQFLRVAGVDLSGPVADEAVIHGTVADQIRRLEEKLAAHQVRGVRFADVDREARSERYPMEALRQLVRNAFMHRSYEATNAPVRVYWFDDRLEIHNPGGPFGSVTPENFGQPGVTDYRNPNLAEALRALGFVQRFGAGIPVARKALGERLYFAVQPQLVVTIVRGEQS